METRSSYIPEEGATPCEIVTKKTKKEPGENVRDGP
jgi:hypothetical protein